MENLSAIVKNWAGSQPLVKRAYIFGSHAKGCASVNSDLDVAIELVSQIDNEALLDMWIQVAPQYRKSLLSVLPVPLDLQWYADEFITPTVHNGLLSGGVLVYERKQK